jgi:hypothetical protein
VLGKNSINIANFSLGRCEGTAEVVDLVSTKFARSVEFRA